MDGHISSVGIISGALSVPAALSGSLSPPASMSGELSIPTYIDVDVYDGVTEITPTTQMQVLPTRNKTVTDNIIINPIPSNYGLVIWDGSRLTIS